MKKIKIALILLMVISATGVFAQGRNNHETYSEKYGNTLNIGLGIGGYSGYYGYTGILMPILHVNYEFDVAPYFTLAPFVTFYTYHTNNYRETVIPIGAKATYYFDRIFDANSNWDFYLAGSLGFAIRNTTWDSGYTSNDNYTQGQALFLDIHAGAEYHLTRNLGLFLDLSSGVSTIGIAIH